jgi:hypothetical protein
LELEWSSSLVVYVGVRGRPPFIGGEEEVYFGIFPS